MVQRSSASRGSPAAFGRGRFERAQRPAPGLDLRLPAADRVPGRHAAARPGAMPPARTWATGGTRPPVSCAPSPARRGARARRRSTRGSRHGPVRSWHRASIASARGPAQRRAPTLIDVVAAPPRSGCGLRRDARRILLRSCGSGPSPSTAVATARSAISSKTSLPRPAAASQSVSSRSAAALRRTSACCCGSASAASRSQSRHVYAPGRWPRRGAAPGAPSPRRPGRSGTRPGARYRSRSQSSGGIGQSPSAGRRCAARHHRSPACTNRSGRAASVATQARRRRVRCAAPARWHRRPGCSCAARAAAPPRPSSPARPACRTRP